jgi:hypothetical protein
VLQALSNPTVWQLGVLLLLCNVFGVYVLGLWLPQIMRSLSGLSDFMVGVVTALPNLVAAIVMVLVGAHSARSGERLLTSRGGGHCRGNRRRLRRPLRDGPAQRIERQRSERTSGARACVRWPAPRWRFGSAARAYCAPLPDVADAH